MSKEISTYLRGRVLSKILLPLSFREFLKLKKCSFKGVLSSREEAKIKGLLDDYLNTGGFPDVVLGKISKEEFVREYLDVLLFRDFVERFKLENIEAARFLIYSVVQSVGSKISVNKLYRQVKQIERVDRKTVGKYLALLPETLFVFLLRKFSFSTKKSLLSLPKPYIADVAFLEGTGKKMENLVFLELLRKGHEEIFYFQTKEGHEVDFVIKEGLRVKKLIQVTYANNFDEIDKREIRALLHAGNLFKSHKPELIIITWDYEDEKEISWFGKRGRIKFLPLWKWLLMFSDFPLYKENFIN